MKRRALLQSLPAAALLRTTEWLASAQTPTDEPLKGKTLVYILAHPSRDAATANWQAFREDPEWQGVRDKSEANGKLVEKIDSTFLVLTDFSPKLP